MAKYAIVEDTTFDRRYFCTDKVKVNGEWMRACSESDSPVVGDVVEIHKSYNGHKFAIPVPDWIDIEN